MTYDRFPRLLLFLLIFGSCSTPSDPVPLEAGMVIEESVTIEPGRYLFAGADSLDRPVLIIRGEDITVDFNGAELVGAEAGRMPDEFAGLAVRVAGGRNITIKNLTVRGYKVGLLADGVDSLKILDSDFSYNYRQRLQSGRERENLTDWLSYHDNERDEWLRYGAAVYLKNCRQALVRGLRVTGGQNGLLLTGCDEGLFYNNAIQFNSGVGIGLYRSRGNRILHNRLDWNVRGYSHGFYSRGQDSAGILCYEQSADNTFAYNSATHCGDGFFLWAGRQTIDSGEGGSNGNLIYRNDFSFAPANGVEATFSRNNVVGNRMEGCRYGVWGGYSYESLFLGNQITGCAVGLAVENGNGNTIAANLFEGTETGVQLWEREEQPADWRFARRRDVSSRDYRLEANVFLDVAVPLQIGGTERLDVEGNTFLQFDRLLEAPTPNTDLRLEGNLMNQTVGWGEATPFLAVNDVRLDAAAPALDPEAVSGGFQVAPLPDGQETALPEGHPRGRSFILIDEWGPCDFRSPSVWLRGVEDDKYVFLLLGPQGNWKLAGGEGFEAVNPQTGGFPATVTARRAPGAHVLDLRFEFIGEEFTSRQGKSVPRGTPYPFRFLRLEYAAPWRVRWHEYDEAHHPLRETLAFRRLRRRPPALEAQTDTLSFTWWDSPGAGIDPDRFATFAETTLEVPAGDYRLILTSDDGARLYLDGELVIDRWDVHTPAVDAVERRLGGRHRLEVEHFEAGGLATLDFRLELVRGYEAVGE